MPFEELQERAAGDLRRTRHLTDQEAVRLLAATDVARRTLGSPGEALVALTGVCPDLLGKSEVTLEAPLERRYPARR